MPQQTTVTITGFVGADPVRFGREGAPSACSFRVGSTRSYFHAASNEWKDHPTTWVTIKAFRSLAEHVLGSLHKGDPVIVTGRLGTESWQQDGNPRSRMVLEAGAVGHDMSFGTSVLNRSRVPAEASGAGWRRADAHQGGMAQDGIARDGIARDGAVQNDREQPSTPPSSAATAGGAGDAVSSLEGKEEGFADAGF